MNGYALILLLLLLRDMIFLCSGASMPETFQVNPFQNIELDEFVALADYTPTLQDHHCVQCSSSLQWHTAHNQCSNIDLLYLDGAGVRPKILSNYYLRFYAWCRL